MMMSGTGVALGEGARCQGRHERGQRPAGASLTRSSLAWAVGATRWAASMPSSATQASSSTVSRREGQGQGRNAASLIEGRKGVLHGMLTYVLQDENGQVRSTESISAGLDYPGVGPEHAYLKDSGRATYVSVTDEEAVEAFHLLSRRKGSSLPSSPPMPSLTGEAGERDEEEPVDSGHALWQGRQGCQHDREEGRASSFEPDHRRLRAARGVEG